MAKIKLLLAALLVPLLVACGPNRAPETEKIVETQTVKEPVPVWQGLPIAKLEDPALPIEKLNKDSTDKEVAEAYVITIKILQKELKYRTFLLNSYNQNNK